MDTNKLLMIVSIIAIGGLFFGYVVTTFTGFIVTDSTTSSREITLTDNTRLSLIEKVIGITSATKQPMTASDTLLSKVDRSTLGNCEYLGLSDLKAMGIKVEGEKVFMNARDVCAGRYKGCFAGEYANVQTYLDSTGTACSGNIQSIGKDIFLEECSVNTFKDICKTNGLVAAEPYKGEFKDSRYLVAAICCGKL